MPEDKRICSNVRRPGGPLAATASPGAPRASAPSAARRSRSPPSCRPGDLVAGQYEVAGALAHGGLGWIYLARDRNVSDRWVVLKGLLNSGDPDALAAAIAEQQFLAQVEHPLIVEIYNFVTHDGAGYIVMEYVGGTSLKQILKAADAGQPRGATTRCRSTRRWPTSSRSCRRSATCTTSGLVYCDFKPDNLIQVGDAVKLIDLGGVRRIDDETPRSTARSATRRRRWPRSGRPSPPTSTRSAAPWWCCAWSSAATRAPTSSSLPPATRRRCSRARLALPAAREVLRPRPGRPVRLGRRAARADARRAARGRRGRATDGRRADTRRAPCSSRRRRSSSSARLVRAARAAARPTDPQHAWLTSVGSRPTRRSGSPTCSGRRSDAAEVLLAGAQARSEPGEPGMADARPAPSCWPSDPWEWRARLDRRAWPRSQHGDWDGAKASFNAVYGQVPGELAPKLALAVACENGGEPDVAEGLYRTCAVTDATYAAPAAFGLARVRAGRQDIDGRRRGARPGAGHQPRLPGEPPAPRRRAAGRVAGRPGRAGPGAHQHRVGADGPGRAGALHDPDPHPRARRGEAARSRGQRSASGCTGSAATRPRRRASATRSRSPTGRWRATPAELRTRVELVNEANAVRNWTLV